MTKHLTAHEARNLGVIFEVNRQLLHPRGLALEIKFDPDDPEMVAELKIQDWRDDSEGVYFDDLDQDDIDHAEAFAELILPDREQALGYIVQPLDTTTT